MKYESTKANGLGYGRDMKVSPKDTREVAGAIRGLWVESAKKYLSDVIALKTPVPFKRFHREVAHKSGIGPGRYPRNSAEAVLEILVNAEANAKFKGLDPKKLKVAKITVSQGLHKRRGLARAFAKGPSKRSRRSNVEIVVVDVSAGYNKKPAKGETGEPEEKREQGKAPQKRSEDKTK